jgi:hypothetical protein
MPEDSHIHTHRRQNLKSHFEINYLYERSLGGNESSLRERKTVRIKERRDTTVWRIECDKKFVSCAAWFIKLREEYRLRPLRATFWREYDFKRMKRQEVGGNCIMRSSVICTLNQMLLGWPSQGGWGGGLYRARGGDEKYVKTWLGRLKERDHSEDLHVDGVGIKMDHGEIGFGNLHWIHLAPGTDRWRAFVNTVMKLLIPQKSGNFLIR